MDLRAAMRTKMHPRTFSGESLSIAVKNIPGSFVRRYSRISRKLLRTRDCPGFILPRSRFVSRTNLWWSKSTRTTTVLPSPLFLLHLLLFPFFIWIRSLYSINATNPQNWKWGCRCPADECPVKSSISNWLRYFAFLLPRILILRGRSGF